MTLHFTDFLRRGAAFDKILLLPGLPKEGDAVLELRFTEFYQMRDAHPLYLPLALVTLGWYPILGGPVFVDRSSLVGTLSARGPTGEPLASSSGEIMRSRTISMWSSSYALPSGVEARPELVEELVETLLNELEKGPR